MGPSELLVSIAKTFVGVTEIGGDNRGPQVEAFQRALGTPAVGQAWCVDFVQFCVKTVDEQLGTQTVLAPTQSALQLWKDTDALAMTSDPEVGAVAIWQHYDDAGKPTALGHAGIVIEVVSDTLFKTVEGNTGPSQGVEREGDGVYEKTRLLRAPVGSKMRLKGFLRAWIQPDSASGDTVVA